MVLQTKIWSLGIGIFLATGVSLFLLGPSDDRLRRFMYVYIITTVYLYIHNYLCSHLYLSLHFNFLAKGNSSEAATFDLIDFGQWRYEFVFIGGPVYILSRLSSLVNLNTLFSILLSTLECQSTKSEDHYEKLLFSAVLCISFSVLLLCSLFLAPNFSLIHFSFFSS